MGKAIIIRMYNINVRNPLWGKYQQYDYEVLFEMVENILIKLKSDHIAKNIGQASKKLKY